jgi:hypothetical protein
MIPQLVSIDPVSSVLFPCTNPSESRYLPLGELRGLCALGTKVVLQLEDDPVVSMHFDARRSQYTGYDHAGRACEWSASYLETAFMVAGNQANWDA